MILARVVGTVVATRKDPRLEGFKLLIVKPVSPDGKVTSSGKVEFIAQSNNDAVVNTLLAAGGGVAGIAVSVPTARVQGGTTASVEGNITAGSAGVKVEATSRPGQVHPGELTGGLVMGLSSLREGWAAEPPPAARHAA